MLKPSAEQVRELDKKRSTVSLKTALKLACERTVTVVIQIIIITDVQRRSGARRPANQKLSSNACRQRIVINPCARKCEASEIITRAERPEILIVSCASAVDTSQTALRV